MYFFENKSTIEGKRCLDEETTIDETTVVEIVLITKVSKYYETLHCRHLVIIEQKLKLMPH